jgi:hypothetical protein
MIEDIASTRRLQAIRNKEEFFYWIPACAGMTETESKGLGVRSEGWIPDNPLTRVSGMTEQQDFSLRSK